MPAMGVGGGGGPAPRPAPLPRAPAPRGAGVTDTQMPGPSDKQVAAYKASPAYHHAVAAVFKAQPTAQKVAIVRGLARTPAAQPERQAVNKAISTLGDGEKLRIAAALNPSLRDLTGNSLLGGIGHAISGGLGDVATGIDALRSATQIGPKGPGNIQTMGGAGPALSKVLTSAPIDVARAAVESPGVIPKTVKGFGESIPGMVAGAVQLPIRAVTEGPGQALGQLGQQIKSDYSRRYGPLLQPGGDRAFINRIKQEGAAPEAFDAFIAAGGLDATAGRAIAGLGKTRVALTGTENFLTRERPNLLLSGAKTRSQQLASTAGRITAQRLEDKLREMRQAIHPGELRPNDKQVAPIFQEHAIRVTHSGIAQRWRRGIQESLQREVRGRSSSALTAIGKLNGWQKQAIYHAVHGIRMDTPANLRADLADRRAQILADRQSPASLGNRIPAHLADKVDELGLIDRLMAHADKVAGPKMVRFQAGEAARAQRIEAATALHPATAEARRLRPIGDRLGIEHPDVANARLAGSPEVAARGGSRSLLPFGAELNRARATGRATTDASRFANYGASRAEHLAGYVKQVRARMEKQGLPEPGYFQHREFPGSKFGDYTSGSGHRAMPGDKTSTWALHRAGVADHSAQAYLDGLARSVKRPLQWRLTDEQFRAGALPTPTRDEIKGALGQNKAPHLLTGHELRRVMTHRGEDPAKLTFYNPGRLAEQTLADRNLLPKGKLFANEHEEQISTELHHALTQEPIVQRGDKTATDHFLTTQGWKALPKTAFDEIHAGLKGGSLAGRSFGKVQGTTAGLILGQNPHFLIMNTLAHLFPAVAGTGGRIIPDLLKTPVWWHGLSDAEKDRVRMFEGGRGNHYAVTARLGSTAPTKIAAFGRKLDEQGLVQKAKVVNPFHAILRGEDIQSNFFRHAVMYHEAKRLAFQDMAHEYGRAVTMWEQVKHIFTLGPQERTKAILQNMTKIEDLGRTTVNILGDYGRFTAREQAFFKRGVLFYSFLRHVTRTLLYVLPVRHPLAFGLLGELGNLHVQEVRKLLGGQDLPWAYGRMFFDPKGKLSSVDLTSTSPVSSPLVDVLSGGVKQLPRLLTPAFGPAFDLAYGQTPTGAKIKQNAWTYLNDLFSLSYPYRMASAFRHGLRAQQSDSVPFLHERPQNFKTAKSQQYQEAKRQARGPLSRYLLGSTLGVYPKPDDSRVIAAHAAAAAARKGRGKGGGGTLPSLSGVGDILPGGSGPSDILPAAP